MSKSLVTIFMILLAIGSMNLFAPKMTKGERINGLFETTLALAGLGLIYLS